MQASTVMAIDSFQRYLETALPEALVPVNLTTIAKNHFESGKTEKYCLVIDGECCLHRLYGGYYGDWVCGGQFNRMFRFMRTLSQEAQKNHMEITVCLSGAEEDRRSEWIQKQLCARERMRLILRHSANKGTPPPKVWWVPPNGIRSCLINMLRELKMNVVVTTEDHHVEVMSFLKTYNQHALLADHPDYLFFQPPRYFSSIHLKLSFKGVFETQEYLLSEVKRSLGLNYIQLPLVAALLGNHILSGTDLASFHTSLCPKIMGQILPNTLVDAVVSFVKKAESLSEVESQIFGSPLDERCKKLKRSVHYYSEGFKKNNQYCEEEKEDDSNSTCINWNQLKQPDKISSMSSNSEFASDTFSSEETTSDKFTPVLSPDVKEMTLKRLQRGILHPFIYQIIFQGEIIIPVILEDGAEFPCSRYLYRPLRQMVYGILFNEHQRQEFFQMKQAEELKQCEIAAPIPNIMIKEWVCSNANQYEKPDLVPPKLLDWAVSPLSYLWLQRGPEANDIRLKAFLTCMRSNSSLMRDPNYVPQHLVMLCCVLRYLITSPKMPFIQKCELDAFLSQAVDPHLKNPDYCQNLELSVISPRGVMLAAIFMHGIDLAIMANDACGTPIPHAMCSPWLFFDGKLFHHKLLKSYLSNNLTDLCDKQFEAVSTVEQIRAAIVEDLHVKFLPHSIPDLLKSATPPPVSKPATPPPVPKPATPPPVPILKNLGRGLLLLEKLRRGGGQLQVVGVGSCGPHLGRGQHESGGSNLGRGQQISSGSHLGRGQHVFCGSHLGRGHHIFCGSHLGRGQPKSCESYLGRGQPQSCDIPSKHSSSKSSEMQVNCSKTVKESDHSSSPKEKSPSAKKAIVCLGMARGAPITGPPNELFLKYEKDC